MKLYLVRHGETKWNKEGRMQGSKDIALDEYGIRLAEITAEAMRQIPVEVIFSSPLCRAYQTAQIMKGKRQIPIIVDERLQEMNFGSFEGCSIQEAREQTAHPMHAFFEAPEQYRTTGGETFVQVMERANAFIRQVLIPAQTQYEHVMIASHGAFIRCFLMCVDGRALSGFWKGIPQKNCAVTSLEMQDGRLRILEEGKLYYTL